MASIGVGIIIGFVYSWQLTLGILAFVPLIGIAGYLEMKLMQRYSSEGREALESAGKASTIRKNKIVCSRRKMIIVKHRYWYL